MKGILFIISIFLIANDFIYKMRIKSNASREMLKPEFYKRHESFTYKITGLVYTIYYTIVDLLKKNPDQFTIISCLFLILLVFIFDYIKCKEINNRSNILRSFASLFPIGWLGFDTFVTIGLAKQENNYFLLLFSVQFYIFGILIHKIYIKINK